MADIFDEIDEDLKRDHMQLLWARYGKIFMAVVLAIVLLVALRQGYTAWQTSRSEASASAFQQALQSDDVIGVLESQLGQLSDGYKMLAQFQIAAERAASGDFVAAEQLVASLNHRLQRQDSATLKLAAQADLLIELTGQGRFDGEILTMTLPIPQALIQMVMFLTALTFMYLAARAVGDKEYRAQYLDPLVEELLLTLVARDRYRTATAT